MTNSVKQGSSIKLSNCNDQIYEIQKLHFPYLSSGGASLESSFFSVFAYQFWCSRVDSRTAMGTPDWPDEILFRLTQNQSSLGESMNSLIQKIEELLTRVSPALSASASPSMSFPPSPTVPTNTHRMKLDVPRFDGTNPLGWVFKINQFFEYHRTPETERLTIASFSLKNSFCLK